MEDEHLAAISEYRRELEMLPRKFGGLGNLSRREQLAYWLNLYNVTIIEQVGYRYPIVNLRRFHLGSRKRPGLLDKKLLTVMGARLSLNDIQNRILIPVFENPLVLYGLHQGVVGSPNIRRTAYRGGNVWDSLRLNAIDFVNSIRGVHLRKNVARASEFYARGAAAFPQGLPGLRRHLVAYADDRTQEILDAAGKIETNYFDWHIADLYNGRPNPVSIYANRVTDLSGVPRTLETRIPDHVQRYMAGLKMKFLEFGYPRTTVTIEDRPRNENAIDSALENKNEDDKNSNQQNFFRLR